ncbi:peptidylglycine alpha-hydroxylating monooxygenase [Belonocnema kinseyi]|uniref:peptidylglycine alpha-hydroxylating monooxygenase n=1 Tax=Belonocnema kinseyi TaxID=2817044 RepID=UPI00143CF811|nr:peptidylglycine alpha-hydroxylating monooxygenase [Belonocnema kinseyi]
MSILHAVVSVILILTLFWGMVQCDDDSIRRFPLLMPNVKPFVPELYLCTPVRMDNSRAYYIVGFEPNATMATAHHILIYGCSKPGSSKPVWMCGEMAKQSIKSGGLTSASPCGADSQIIYAWARDAPKLNLPNNVGFKVGGDSPIQYLVLQVHYAHIEAFEDGSTDDSGIFLHYTTQPMPNLAGVYLLGTGGEIPARSTEHMETACVQRENVTIHPFAYRTHTHSLGDLVTGYVKKPNNEWIELGKKDPMKPQMFYPIHDKRPINQNDTLAARCTMISNRDRVTYIGGTNNDEMCNFYLMYYVENGEPLQQKYCFSAGPPSYYWKNDKELVNIPDKEASTP